MKTENCLRRLRVVMVSGDEITPNVRTISDIPLTLKGDFPAHFFMRGEIYLTRKNFDKINRLREEEGLDPFMNPRNTASGSLKMQDSAEVRKRGLSSVLYQFISDEVPAENPFGNCFRKLRAGLQNLPAGQNYVKQWLRYRNLLLSGTQNVIIFLLKLMVLF